MARPIDANALIQGLKNNRLRILLENENDGAAVFDDIVNFIDYAPTLNPPTEPLTLEQLRKMDGEPVYIVFFPDADGEKLQFWALVAVDEWGEIYLMNNLGGSSAYEEVWADIEAIYRRPPEGEKNT